MTPRIAVIVPSAVDGATGGAERLYTGLCDALRSAGLETELIDVPCDERDFNGILRAYVDFHDLELRHFDGVISTKAPSYVVRHPNHVCYLVHTMRVFYDMFDREFPVALPEVEAQRRTIRELDTAALAPTRLAACFAIGEEVAARLAAFNGRTARVLHPPTSFSGLHWGAFRHLLLPGRLHRWKRVDLAIAAMRHVAADIPLIIPGTGDDAERLCALAEGDPRIRFPGHVDDGTLRDLYADALAVLFLPEREDLGLVTFEAFQSGKPVITATDAGEPARLVRDGESGFVCAPDAQAIAARIAMLAADPAHAAAMGARGAESIRHVTWARVAETLAAALGFAPVAA